MAYFDAFELVNRVELNIVVVVERWVVHANKHIAVAVDIVVDETLSIAINISIKSLLILLNLLLARCFLMTKRTVRENCRRDKYPKSGRKLSIVWE